MLAPKRVRHRKVQRGSMKGKAKGYTTLNHGSYGIQAQQAAWITNRQIEAARIAMTRYMKRGGKVWITICRRGNRQGSSASCDQQAAHQVQDRFQGNGGS